ncbi:MAG: type II toxin-antitoxin system VapC family toxin [Aquificae bacterium]|nr:type II toxin-antitoxin system VapC family toxin [Aquificota bacterium]
MNCKGTIDTNVILRFLLKDNESHANIAEDIIYKAREQGEVFFVPIVVIMELVFVLSRVYKLDRDYVVQIVKSLSSLPAEVEKEKVVFEALELYKNGMKFSDALIYCQAVAERRTPLYTFDKDDFQGLQDVVLLR